MYRYNWYAIRKYGRNMERWLIFFVILLEYSAPSRPLSFMLMHNGDMHSKFEEFPGGYDNVKVGGFARTRHIIKETYKNASAQGMPAYYLNSGDTLTGSLWYMVHGWKIAAKFMRILAPTVMCLGVHDFDTSLRNLSYYLRAVGRPVVCANANFSKEHYLSLLIRPYHILKIGKLRIAVVGYITPRVIYIAPTGSITVTNIIPTLQKLCAMLKATGVQFIIGLGHAGIVVDTKIAEHVKDIDIIIGGMSHTFLWNGIQPGPDVPSDTYPKIVKRSDGKNVLILHSGSHTRYLGRLLIDLDSEGRMMDFSERAVYMSNEVPQDPSALRLLNAYRPEINKHRERRIGKSKVFLDANCKRRECNFGNMIADAFVDFMAARYVKQRKNNTYWSDCGIGIVNGDAIKASVPKGNITIGDIQQVLPYNHRLITMYLTGEDIINFFERAIRAEYFPNESEFIQVSGLQLAIDANMKIKHRIVSVTVRCTKCTVPNYIGIVKSRQYKLVATVHMLRG
ncbi:hypothetical protein Trydic_g5432 [Trypoxylus dichotomus]